MFVLNELCGDGGGDPMSHQVWCFLNPSKLLMGGSMLRKKRRDRIAIFFRSFGQRSFSGERVKLWWKCLAWSLQLELSALETAAMQTSGDSSAAVRHWANEPNKKTTLNVWIWAMCQWGVNSTNTFSLEPTTSQAANRPCGGEQHAHSSRGIYPTPDGNNRAT